MHASVIALVKKKEAAISHMVSTITIEGKVYVFFQFQTYDQ